VPNSSTDAQPITLTDDVVNAVVNFDQRCSSATLWQRRSYGFPGVEILEKDILTSDNESRPAIPVQGINLIAMLN